MAMVGALGGIIADGIWRGIDALIQQDKDNRAEANKNLVQHLVDQNPGWTFVVCWVEHKCEGYSEKFKGELPVYGFNPAAKGRFELLGDGGYLNWAINGHFNRHENVCDIIGPESEPKVAQPPTWTQGQFYAQGTVVRFEGADFVCNQDHTAAGIDWTPPNVPVFWRHQ